MGGLHFYLINRTLDDLSQQASLISMYSLVGRIRMISSDAVFEGAGENRQSHRRVLQAPSDDL